MIPSTWQQRQKDQEFKASLGSVRLCLEKVKVESEEAGEVAQRLRTAALLPEGRCLALSAYMRLQFKGIQHPPLLPQKAGLHMVHRHTCGEDTREQEIVCM